jgi:hypothetical protein
MMYKDRRLSKALAHFDLSLSHVSFMTELLNKLKLAIVLPQNRTASTWGFM